MSPSSTVHGQQDTKYVTFELLMHAAFVADEFWGFMLGQARTPMHDNEYTLPPRQQWTSRKKIKLL